MSNIRIFECGYCKGFERFVLKDGSFNLINFPAKVALIPLNEGFMLFDCGYPSDFELLKKKYLCFKLYSMILPTVSNEDTSGISQLKKAGINPEEIKYVFISHFHVDHAGGMKDFPNAKFICSQVEYQQLKISKSLTAVMARKLLPDDFEERTLFVEDFRGNFIIEEGLFPIHLPGHTNNQYGLLCKNYKTLLASDSAWSDKAYMENKLPPALSMLIMEDKKKYIETINLLAEISKDNKIVISHSEVKDD